MRALGLDQDHLIGLQPLARGGRRGDEVLSRRQGDGRAGKAPRRYAQWLDQLREPAEMRDYDSLDAVAARLMKNNPLLRPDFAD